MNSRVPIKTRIHLIKNLAQFSFTQFVITCATKKNNWKTNNTVLEKFCIQLFPFARQKLNETQFCVSHVYHSLFCPDYRPYLRKKWKKTKQKTKNQKNKQKRYIEVPFIKFRQILNHFFFISCYEDADISYMVYPL